MIDRQASLFFAMNEGEEAEVLQPRVGLPLIVDYMWNKHFSMCQNMY